MNLDISSHIFVKIHEKIRCHFARAETLEARVRSHIRTFIRRGKKTHPYLPLLRSNILRALFCYQALLFLYIFFHLVSSTCANALHFIENLVPGSSPQRVLKCVAPRRLAEVDARQEEQAVASWVI